MPIDISLRPVEDGDLPVFFAHQQDLAACHMAAFTAKDPADRDAFESRWARLRRAPAVTLRTIVVDGRVAGHAAIFGPVGEREVTYWIGSEFWGRGVATAALARLLDEIRERPIMARAAADHPASIRVLEKCGFRVTGRGRFFANARGAEIEEVVMTLRPDSRAARAPEM